MKPLLAPAAPLPAAPALLTHYQNLRARYRLAIRSLIKQYKNLYPRRLDRFVPVLVPMKWTVIDPGCPDLIYNSMRDDMPFGSMAWELSGLIRVTDKGRTKHKVISKASLSVDAKLPWVCQIMDGGFNNDEARRVQVLMARINAVVIRYRNLHEHFIVILEHAEPFNCSDDTSLLGDDMPPNPYEGLPDRTIFKRRKQASAETVRKSPVVEE